MTERWTGIITVAACVLAGCGDDGTVPPRPVPECTEMVTLSVSSDSIPLFSWTGDCAIGRLTVEEGGVEERWGTEMNGVNTFVSPIRYSVHPPGTPADQMTDPAQPLFAGHSYRATIYRWIVFMPVESLQVVGVQDFIPSVDSPLSFP